jgi:hypothetical protein
MLPPSSDPRHGQLGYLKDHATHLGLISSAHTKVRPLSRSATMSPIWLFPPPPSASSRGSVLPQTTEARVWPSGFSPMLWLRT